jgi:hypothetical protein
MAYQEAMRRIEDAPLVATGRYARGRERAERYREIRRRGTAIIKNDPVAVALDGIASVSRIILGRETSEWGVLLGMTALSPAWRTLRVLLTFAWLPLVVAAIVGLVRVRWDVPVVLPGLLVVVYLVVLSAGPESSARFRLAFIPVVCVFAAAGVVRVRHGASAAATTVRHAG